MMLNMKKTEDSRSLIQSDVLSSGVTQTVDPPVTMNGASLVSAGPGGYPGSPLCVSFTPLQTLTPNAAQQLDIKVAPSGYVFTAGDPESALHQTFLKGKPYALGVVLIITAIGQIGLAIFLSVFEPLWSINTGIQFWGPMCHILAGSFSISAQKKLTLLKVRMSLVFGALSCLSAMGGIIVNIADVSLLNCEPNCLEDHTTVMGIILSFIFSNLLVLCVSASLSSFGCGAMTPDPSKDRLVLVIQNDVLVSKPPPGSSACYTSTDAFQEEKKKHQTTIT